jgi:Glu-tRNA(Gln) amidotransferase subunit E-like FAD-binding protein
VPAVPATILISVLKQLLKENASINLDLFHCKKLDNILKEEFICRYHQLTELATICRASQQQTVLAVTQEKELHLHADF